MVLFLYWLVFFNLCYFYESLIQVCLYYNCYFLVDFLIYLFLHKHLLIFLLEYHFLLLRYNLFSISDFIFFQNYKFYILIRILNLHFLALICFAHFLILSFSNILLVQYIYIIIYSSFHFITTLS